MNLSGLAVKVIRGVGIFGLCKGDGCACISFSVHRVNVEIRCYKTGCNGEMLVRAHSRSMDYTIPDLQLVADEVVRQIREESPLTPINVRLCCAEDDRNNRCIYCGEPRSESDEYFCDKHAGEMH